MYSGQHRLLVEHFISVDCLFLFFQILNTAVIVWDKYSFKYSWGILWGRTSRFHFCAVLQWKHFQNGGDDLALPFQQAQVYINSVLLQFTLFMCRNNNRHLLKLLFFFFLFWTRLTLTSAYFPVHTNGTEYTVANVSSSCGRLYVVKNQVTYTHTYAHTHTLTCAHTPLILLIVRRWQQVDLGRHIEMDSDPNRDN